MIQAVKSDERPSRWRLDLSGSIFGFQQRHRSLPCVPVSEHGTLQSSRALVGFVRSKESEVYTLDTLCTPTPQRAI